MPSETAMTDTAYAGQDSAESIDPRWQLGQFIPPHYHYNMLRNPARMVNFRAAIEAVVRPGQRVLELGGGTGVLSFYAARQGASVRCVEFNPELLRVARGLLARNGVGERVELIEADGFTYLPPEPVDVVICEMIHTALLREKQVAMISEFKRRYRSAFGDRLPRFIPEGVISAAQPVQQDYRFFDYEAPGPVFNDPVIDASEGLGLAQPYAYQRFLYDDQFPERYVVDQSFSIDVAGTFNAVRFVTRNLLAILPRENRSIDWLIPYLTFPIRRPFAVVPGDIVDIAFAYGAGDDFAALSGSLRASRRASHGA